MRLQPGQNSGGNRLTARRFPRKKKSVQSPNNIEREKNDFHLYNNSNQTVTLKYITNLAREKTQHANQHRKRVSNLALILLLSK